MDMWHVTSHVSCALGTNGPSKNMAAKQGTSSSSDHEEIDSCASSTESFISYSKAHLSGSSDSSQAFAGSVSDSVDSPDSMTSSVAESEIERAVKSSIADCDRGSSDSNRTSADPDSDSASRVGTGAAASPRSSPGGTSPPHANHGTLQLWGEEVAQCNGEEP